MRRGISSRHSPLLLGAVILLLAGIAFALWPTGTDRTVTTATAVPSGAARAEISATDVAASLPAALPVPPPAASAGYTALAFHDEFDRDSVSLDSSGDGPWWDGAGTYLGRENIRIADSVLTLHYDGKHQGGIATAPQSFDKGQAFRYGYFEARIKFDQVKAAWPAWWLFSLYHMQGKDKVPHGQEWAEWDIFEGDGSVPGLLITTIHDWVNFKNSQNGNNIHHMNADLSQWHVYGALAVPGKVTWYFDDKPFASAAEPAIFGRDAMMLNLSVNDHGGAPPYDMKIDWVRVWQRPR